MLSMNASGIWRGRLHGRVGHFKFINVEVIPEQRISKNHNNHNSKSSGRLTVNSSGCSSNNSNNGPSTVEELLFRIGLKEYTSVFILNG